MIKFFRKIRQQLLTENKFSKYMLYAIGEIVLVVIGILIAIQLNTWKENKKKSDLGYSYLIEMRYEVEQDVIELDQYLKRINEWTQGHEDALNSRNFDHLPLDSLYNVVRSMHTGFEINEETYNKMKNLGLTSLSKNEELNSQINTYYYVHLARLKKFTDAADIAFNRHKEYFFHQQENIQMQPIRQYEFPFVYDQSIEDFNAGQRNAIIKFVNSKKGRVMILTELGWKRRTYQRVNEFRKQTEDLLSSIDAVLKAKNLQIE